MNLTKYDYHEVLDRTYIFASLIERELKNHPVIKKNKKLNKKLDKALKYLYEVYQEIGGESIK